MSFTNSACQICQQIAILISTCPNCKSRYYCSQACQEKDNKHACQELKNKLSQISDQKRQNAIFLAQKFNKTYTLLTNNFLSWKTTQSYKTNTLSEYLMIYYEYNNEILVSISSLGKINAAIHWPNIDCKKSIPVILCNDIGSVSLTIKF